MTTPTPTLEDLIRRFAPYKGQFERVDMWGTPHPKGSCLRHKTRKTTSGKCMACPLYVMAQDLGLTPETNADDDIFRQATGCNNDVISQFIAAADDTYAHDRTLLEEVLL